MGQARWDVAYADLLLDLFQLSPRSRVTQLSTGMRSALGIVVGLATRAPLTIFDESYLGLDAPSRYAFYDELLTDYAEHPRTLIISTHLIEEVASLFEEVVIIDRGRLVLHQEADAVRDRGVAVTGPFSTVGDISEQWTSLPSPPRFFLFVVTIIAASLFVRLYTTYGVTRRDITTGAIVLFGLLSVLFLVVAAGLAAAARAIAGPQSAPGTFGTVSDTLHTLGVGLITFPA